MVQICKKYTKALKYVITFKPFQMEQCLNGIRFALIIFTAAESALSQDIVNCLPLIQINRKWSSLWRCFKCTKRSPKGRTAYFDSCEIKNMPKQVIPTPVKTRLLSVVVIIKMILKYKKVFDECFRSQRNLNLRQIIPTNDTWDIGISIVHTL